MKYDLLRLKREPWRLKVARWYVKYMLLRRAVLDHPVTRSVLDHVPQFVSVVVGLGLLPLAIMRDMVGGWALVSAMFGLYFVITDRLNRRVRAHWVGDSHTRPR